MDKKGLLLINLGTPNAPTKSAVKSYLQEFLMDKRVVDLPFWIRLALVYGIIAPFRSKKSAENYAHIWTNEGSPLAIHTQKLTYKVSKKLGKNFQVAHAMRYGQPSISEGLKVLKNCNEIIILPLYPQYASATNGSSIEAVFKELSAWDIIPTIRIIKDFYQHPAYINALTNSIKPYLKDDHHLLLSYHGLPEKALLKIGCQKICQDSCLANKNAFKDCYRYQCYQTSQLIAKTLKLSTKHYTTAFQSRLGKTPWIKPFTDETLKILARQGIQNIAIACPSFVADCLETLEEIGISAQKQWKELGGKEFKLIPCLNAEDEWIDALTQIISE